MTLPVALLYHAIRPLPRGSDFVEKALCVEPDTFAQQMDHLARRGYRTLTLEEYGDALGGRAAGRKRFLLTFDDAYEEIGEAVTPVLRRLGYSAVMFVPWAHLGARNTWDTSHPRLSSLRIMTAAQVKTLAAGPWEVASHGGRHVDLRCQAAGQRRRELREARARLSELLGQEVRALAYPFGRHNAHVRADANAAGFDLAFTATAYGPIDRLGIPRRAITSFDRGPLFDLRIARRTAWIYRLEDALRLPVRAGRRLLAEG